MQESTLRNLYIKQGLSTIDIGRMFNITHGTVSYYLNKYKIPTTKGRRIKDDLTGKRFGILTVLHQTIKPERKTLTKLQWVCRCDCGKVKQYRSYQLVKEGISSCGCLNRGKRHSAYKGYQGLSGVFFGKYKYDAKRRKLSFNLTPKYIWDLLVKQNHQCHFTGRQLTLPSITGDSFTASLDRIDSTKGYIKGNVQWTHHDINIAKQRLTNEAFVQLCKEVALHS